MIKELIKEKGFMDLIKKIGIFLLSGFIIAGAIELFFRNTTFSINYLTIPRDFILEASNIRTIFINALLFGLVAFSIYSFNDLKKIKKYSFDRKQYIFMGLTLISLILKYLLLFMINAHTEFFMQAVTFWGVIKIFTTILFVIMLTLSVFSIKFVKEFAKKFKKEILLVIGLSVTFFFLMLLVQNLWTVFSSTISEILYRLFSLFFDDVIYKPFVVSFTMAEGGGPLLGVNGFRAIVGKPCSGIDSFLLFTSLYALIAILDFKKLHKPKTIAFFFIGVAGMFLTNLLRIFALYMVGVYYDAKFAVGLFHTNVGWILFIGYFFVFWWIASKFVYLKDPEQSEKKIVKKKK